MKNIARQFMWVVAAMVIGLHIVVVTPQAVFAQPEKGAGGGGDAITATELGLYYGEATGLGTEDLRVTIARIIRTGLGLLGIVALVIILAGGVVWMTAGGSEDKVKIAKKIILNGVIGLAIILSAFSITHFILTSLVEGTTGGAGAGQAGGDGGEGGGFGGRGCANPPCAAGFSAKISPKGQQRIQQVTVKINFQDRGRAAAYDPASLILGETVKVYKTDDRDKTPVAVDLVQVSASEVRLSAKDPCLPPNDQVLTCFEPNVSYTVELTTNIKQQGSGKALYCPLAGSFSCKQIIIAGSEFDAEPPTVQVTSHRSGESVPLGETVDITARARDNIAVDLVQYEIDGAVVYTNNAENDPAELASTFAWEVNAETYKPMQPVIIRVQASDTDNNTGSSGDIRLIPRPKHCFDGKQNEDEQGLDCGGQWCGACAGAACKADAECAGGACRIPAGQQAGVCVQLPLITAVTPGTGAPGTIITIQGKNFGAEAGQVVLYKDANDPASAVPAAAGACGVRWANESITVAVPEGLPMGVAAPIGVRNAAGETDRTDDDRGAKFDGTFTTTNQAIPGLCEIEPAQGLPNDRVTVRGVNLGAGGDASRLLFGDEAVRVQDWNQDREGRLGEVVGFVPNLEAERVPVRVTVGTETSNAVLFTVKTVRDQDRPNIIGVNPAKGPAGTYVTVTGRGFGASGTGGVVVFESKVTGQTAIGDTNFPDQCDASALWSDANVVVKVPQGMNLDGAAGGVAAYKVYVRRGAQQIESNTVDFGVETQGSPRPGICKIDPTMRAAGGIADLYGEYFGREAGKVVFWDKDAVLENVESGAVARIGQWSDGHIQQAIVPETAATGLVRLSRAGDNAVSNGLPFTVGDCKKNNNQCPVAGQECCQAGFLAGSCQASCAAAAKSAEYAWIFSTGKIPVVPRVVQCCGQSCPKENPLPSPAPWVTHPGSAAVCTTVMVRGTFTTNIDLDRGNPTDKFILERCSAGGDAPCDAFTEIHRGANVQNGAGLAEFSFSGEHTPVLLPNSTYQVRVLAGLWSLPNIDAGSDGGEMRADPTAVAACGGADHAQGTAYCFRFKTGNEACSVGAVEVIPGAFTAQEFGWLVQEGDHNVVEERSDDDKPLYHAGLTALGNKCVALDPAGRSWEWRESSNGVFASLERRDSPEQFVRALRITEENPVTINASTGGVTGAGTLAITAGEPKMIATWPQCQTACVNTEVGISFNIAMMPQTLNEWGIGLYRCRDELCRHDDILEDVMGGKLSNLVASIDYEDNPGADSAPYEKHRAQLVTRNALEPGKFYRMLMFPSVQSAYGVSIGRARDQYDLPVEAFGQSWILKSFTFRVRDDNKPCQIASVAVQPGEAVVRSIGGQRWFNARAQGEANGCGPGGGAERLSAENMSWNWTSADPRVVSLQTFDVADHPAPGCTSQCLLTGSQARTAVCGNARLDAGEDCDPPNGTWCTDRCLFSGSAAPLCGNGNVNDGEQCDDRNTVSGDGCSDKCLAEGSKSTGATCGNRDVALGENCDDGNAIAGDGCSSNCLKEGTSVSEAWCRDQGARALETYPACAQAVAVCGNAILETGEACDPPQEGVCTQACLLAGGPSASCGNGIVESDRGEECDDGDRVNGAGCNKCRFRGSSLTYSTPSLCSDGLAGIGEAPRCEIGQHGDGADDPKVLATLASTEGHEAELELEGREGEEGGRIEVEITAEATYNEARGSGTGTLALQCGLNPAVDTCPNPATHGVAANGCCYPYPVLRDPAPRGEGACQNPIMQVTFESGVSKDSLNTNVVLAVERFEACPAGEEEVAFDAPSTRIVFENSWWHRVALRVRHFVGRLFGVANAAYRGDVPLIDVVTQHESALTSAYQKINTIGGYRDATAMGRFMARVLAADPVAAASRDTWRVWWDRTMRGPAADLSRRARQLKEAVQANPEGDYRAAFIVFAGDIARFNATVDGMLASMRTVRAGLDARFTDGDRADIDARVIQFMDDVIIDYNRAANLLSGARLSRWCASTLRANYKIIPNDDGSTTVQILPRSLLAANTRYRVTLLGGDTRDAAGAPMGVRDGRNIPLRESYNWSFATGRDICTLDEVRVTPAAWVFGTTQRATGPLCTEDADCGTGGLCGDAAGGAKRCDLSQRRFVARAYTGRGGAAQELASIPGQYEWNFAWGPEVDGIVEVAARENGEGAIVSAVQGKSGEEAVTVSATITADTLNTPSEKDRVITGSADVTVASCEHPWPALDGGLPVFPYEDVANNDDGIGDVVPDGENNIFTNWSTWYCMDGASVTTSTDDLPPLQTVVQYRKNNQSSLMKRFHFTNLENNDLIGVMVRTNPKWLPLDEWYEEAFPGQGKLRVMKAIDGFEAARLADTIYVNAVNYNSNDNSLFANVYIFSMSGVGGRQPSTDTRTIFDQMIKNVKFTANIPQYNRCALPDNQHPDPESPRCSANADCAGNFAGRACLADRDKIRRDLTRVQDAQTILRALREHKTATSTGHFPLLTEVSNQAGSFVPLYTTSKWGSWQAAFGNTLGKQLPQDPVNKFVGCTAEGDDPETCWNAGAQQMHACREDWQVYQYRTNAFGDVAEVRMNFEFFNETHETLMRRLRNEEGSGAIFAEGACAVPGVVFGAGLAACGNGVVEGAEVCERGTERRDQCLEGGQRAAVAKLVNGRATFDALDSYHVYRCKEDCSAWDTQHPVRLSVGRCADGFRMSCTANNECQNGVACRTQQANGQPQTDTCFTSAELRRLAGEGLVSAALVPGALCGNGRVDPDEREVCDDGALNGRYGGYCTSDCSGRTGYCGNSLKEPEELCDPTFMFRMPGFPPTPDRHWYSESKDTSCGLSCQTVGRYCGDGTFDPEESHLVNGVEMGCDDGNKRVGDGCTGGCDKEPQAAGPPPVDQPVAFCGNSALDSGEICDSGVRNGQACQAAAGEQCSYCSANCQNVLFASGPYCGDGLVNRRDEACDGAAIPGYFCLTSSYDVWAEALSCNQACTEPSCSDPARYQLCHVGDGCSQVTVVIDIRNDDDTFTIRLGKTDVPGWGYRALGDIFGRNTKTLSYLPVGQYRLQIVYTKRGQYDVRFTNKVRVIGQHVVNVAAKRIEINFEVIE
ncbi:MAG: IPT/TIG domain-containing protein [Candidatus Magasanikbacteria bacterium]|nr:IPT/TIG domain-containing protein [Candidatus Magasanikbacteria bacterium]